MMNHKMNQLYTRKSAWLNKLINELRLQHMVYTLYSPQDVLGSLKWSKPDARTIFFKTTVKSLPKMIFLQTLWKSSQCICMHSWMSTFLTVQQISQNILEKRCISCLKKKTGETYDIIGLLQLCIYWKRLRKW